MKKVSLSNVKKYIPTGFTMIELLVVTTIIIVLTTIGLVSYQQVGQNSRNSRRKSDLEMVRQALVLYRTNRTTAPLYPLGTGNQASFESMLTDLGSYLNTATVTDPKNETPHVYTYTSDGSTFSICAELEPTSGVPYCVTNP
jgi:prepilin-type N-terminal cleavage/methylation domain-containing protein